MIRQINSILLYKKENFYLIDFDNQIQITEILNKVHVTRPLC